MSMDRRAAEDAKAAEQRGREALRRVRMERAAAQLIAQLEEQLQARRAAAAAAAAAASPTRAPAAYSGRYHLASHVSFETPLLET